MSILHRLRMAALPFALLLCTARSRAAEPANDMSPLVEKVRASTARLRDINVALADGFVQGTPCVNGPMWESAGGPLRPP
jgi:hypothetical protein